MKEERDHSLGRRFFSTSDLTRRNKNGLKILCSASTTFLLFSSSPFASSLFKNVFRSSYSEKISGQMKLSSENSSCRLFCKGVPVMSNRPRDVNERTILARTPSAFLMRCASSMTRYSKDNFFNGPFSIRQISKDVMQTSKSCVKSRDWIISDRSSLVPVKSAMLKSGAHFSNSRAQFCNVDFGTTMRCGPLVSRWCLR